MTEKRVLLIGEVAEILELSVSSINRYLGQSRKGIGNFPNPISTPGGKLRWLAADINQYLESQASAASPMPARTKRRNAAAVQARQNATEKALDRFRTRGGNQ